MKRMLLLAGLVLWCTLSAGAQQAHQDYPISPVSFTQVSVTDHFWKPRIDTNANVTLPYAFQKCEEEGRIDNFIFAGGLKEGKWRGLQGFDDSDVYKVLEGAAFTYQVNKDERLRQYMDSLIYYIGAAQQPDGYLYTAWTLQAKDYVKGIYCVYHEIPYDNLDDSHEFYNAGHMYEAAVAHYYATGQDNFLNIAIKSADHIYTVFGPGKREGIPGHQEIEIGLVKLYRATGNSKYLELAKLFLDRRGYDLGKRGAYNQDHKPVVEQDEAVGHSVRANYMYTAMADIAALTNDEHYKKAIDRIWENVTEKKLYLTGGMGARYSHEAYGNNYELPNISYAETCASIAGVYWNHRMFLLHGDAKYIDVMERIMYNGLISGISLDGTKFFYPNVLCSDGKHGFNRGSATRSEWFTCSCCPTNDVRFMSSIPGYLYATHDNNLYINLYMSNKAEIRVGRTQVALEQQTLYPWDGTIRTIVSPSRRADFAVYLRIPGWATGNPVPGELYAYLNPGKENQPEIKVNGKAATYTLEKGYAKIERRWQKGDVIELTLPMEVKKVLANEKVEAGRGRLALEYGPVVYCVEEADNTYTEQIMIDRNSSYTAEYDSSLLGGLTVLTGEANVISIDNNKVTARKQQIKAIPYYAWNHRGQGSMAVWLPFQIQKVTIQP